MKKRKICVITGTRAEYGIMYWLLKQIQNSAINFNLSGWEIFNHIIILFGVISALVYFFFSKEHKGIIGKVSKIGIYFLMVKE